MNNKLLSIITICYNEYENIRNTCDSVTSQTFHNYEWIVVDGGSTDGTLEILKEYSSYINVLISEKDKGIYDAMNKGIKKAQGKYLLFLNGGDYLYSANVLEDVFNSNALTSGVIYGDARLLYKDGSDLILRFPSHIDKYYLLDICINHQSTFIQKDLFEKYGLYNIKYGILADYEKWMCFQKHKVTFEKAPFVISNFLWFDGKSSSPQYIKQNEEEKRQIINTYFSPIELAMYHLKENSKKRLRNLLVKLGLK